MRVKDRDGNFAEVSVISSWAEGRKARRAMVEIHSMCVWFTPFQARKFAAAVIKAAEEAESG